ncbi:MAG TPA: TetR/AcrR family transcriptional regulator [Acetobacteraceae bacterium]|nr:TetR/AcrR family transcriptional regulator [Acetobacteraceae bacterium]
MSEQLEAERPRGRKPRGQGASRRGEILAAAKRLFAEEGYESATMRRIATAVGVSGAALYVYFPDKEAILFAIAEETFAELLVALEASQQAHGDPLQRFRAGLMTYVEFGRARPDAYRLTFQRKMINPAAPGRHCGDIEAADRSFDILERSVAQLMEAGLFAPGDSVLVAEALWACLHGTTAVLLDHAEHLASDPDALAATVVDTAIRGLLRAG